MKKRLIRFTTLTLALLLVFSLAGCKQGGGGGVTGDFKPLPGEEPVDLGGYEFTVVDSGGGRWSRENPGTPYGDAWVQILDEVESLYNCKITATDISSNDVFTVVQPEIAAGGKYADIICSTQWASGYFLGANLYMDLNELNVNWKNEWWNQDILDKSTYGGKTYLAGGSFIFDTSYTWVLYYNEAIWQELKLPDPYELVNSGKWTQDLFRDYCLRACEDRDGSGVMDSVDDRWGVSAPTSDFCNAWYFALGGAYFRTDDKGRVRLACNNSDAYAKIDAMQTMVRDDKSVLIDAGTVEERFKQFMDGGSLFAAYVPGVSYLKEMEDDWGVMPLPKWNEQQEQYYSGVDHNSPVFGITNTNQDLEQVAVVLEALGRHAMILENIFWPDFKETYWRHEEKDTAIMSNHVVNHGKHDIALLMQNCNSIFKSPVSRIFNSVYGNAPDFASWIDMVEDTISETLQDYFKYSDEETPAA